MTKNYDPLDVELFARIADLREVNESLVAKLEKAQRLAKLNSEHRDRASVWRDDAQAYIEHLEIYLDKTADSTDEKRIFVAECKKLYCKCSGEVYQGPACQNCRQYPHYCKKCGNVSELRDCYSTPEAARKVRQVKL